MTQFLVFVRTSPDCEDTRISSNAKSCLSITNQRSVFRSFGQYWPIRSQYLSITWIFSWMHSKSQTLIVWREMLSTDYWLHLTLSTELVIMQLDPFSVSATILLIRARWAWKKSIKSHPLCLTNQRSVFNISYTLERVYQLTGLGGPNIQHFPEQW